MRWPLYLSPVLLAGGCAGHVTVHPTFPAAYELVAQRDHNLGPEVMVYLYDDTFRMAAVARRDEQSYYIGAYDQITLCDAGDYCVRIEEAPGSLVVFAEPEESLSFDGWHYEVERDVVPRSACDRFTARHPTRNHWFTYISCGVSGIMSIKTYEGQALVEHFELRSFGGLGSS
jgi:hypothetical protein